MATMPKPGADWVQWGEGWVPPDHPLAQQKDKIPKPIVDPTPTSPAPTFDRLPKPVTPQPTTPAPGPGWVNINGGWVPPNHPIATGRPDPTPNLPPPTPQLPRGTPTTQPPWGTFTTAGQAQEWEGPAVASVVQAIPLERLPYLDRLRGFAHTKLGNPNHMTIKYQLGRLFAQYPPTPQGMAELIKNPAFQALGVQSVGGGNIKLPDGAIIDVMTNFQGGGGGWWWGDDRTAGTTPGTPQPGVPQPGVPIPGVPGPGGPAPGTPPPGAIPDPSGRFPWFPETGRWDENTLRYIGASGKAYAWNGTAWVPVTITAPGLMPGPGVPAPGNYIIPGYGSDVTSSEFTDPTTANLEALLNWRINELINPIEDPARQQYADLIQQYIQSLSQADPAITNMIGALESQAKNYLTPSAYEVIGGEEINRLATLDPTFQQAAMKRVGQLEADPYTGAEWEMYRTGVLDPIERDRTAAIDRAMAEISRRGLDPSSGIAQQMLLEVNRQFDQARAQEQGAMGRARVEQRMQRQGEAFDVQTAIDALLNQRRTQRTSLAQNLADWTAGRGERAAELYGTLAEIPTVRAQQQLQGAQTLDALSQAVRGEEQSRRSEALALQGLLAELPERRLQLALATLGQGSTPESLMASLTGLAGLANQRQATSAAQSQANWTGLGSLASILGSLFTRSRGTGATNTNTVWGSGLPE